MEMTGMATNVTHPRSSVDTQPYWDACRREELLFQRCDDCREVVFHPRAACPYCLSDSLTWLQSAGRGRVYSFSIQHVPLHPGRPLKQPKALGIVALDEGFHMFTEILTTDVAGLRIDDLVQVVFDDVGEGVVLPKFQVQP